MKKKISFILCALMAVCFLAACGKEVSVTESMKNDAETLRNIIAVRPNEDGSYGTYTADDREFQMSLSEENFAIYAGNWMQTLNFNISYDAYIAGVKSYVGAESEIGSALSVSEVTAKYNADGLLQTTCIYDCSTRDTEMIVTYSEEGQIVGVKFNPIYTTGENMSRAAMNTLMGMGVVFCVLILISLIISLFAYIPKIQAKAKSKKESKDGSMDNTIQQIISKEEEELADDCELVAVIAAAIAAYEGTSTDGFVVRSIKKSRNWQRL